MAKKETPLTALSKALADAVEKAAASTVTVDARRRFPASGIAYAKDLILTASHVVERDEDIKVILPDGSQVEASLVGRDPGSDLALLRIEDAEAAPAEKTEGEIRPGQVALAIGRPSTEGVQASLGIVSAVGGPTRMRRGGVLEGHIRTDAIPYPGFSGGPLIDDAGRILGINTSGLGHGNSIAIPVEIAWKIAGTLEKHGSIKRGYLGIRSQPVDIPENALKALGREQASGLLLVGIEDDSPASEANLMVGDILVGFNSQAIESADELFSLLSGEVVGSPTPIEVLRGGKLETLKVTLTERAEQPRGRKRKRRMAWGFGDPHHRGRGFSYGRGKGRKTSFRMRHPHHGIGYGCFSLDDDDLNDE
ncbi:MAG: serine protease [Chloroflexi bacterium]|nr:serine protease [Chloroflexota bacterium]